MLKKLLLLLFVLGTLAGCSRQVDPAWLTAQVEETTIVPPATRTLSRPNIKGTAIPCPTCALCPTLPPEPTPTTTPSIGNRSEPVPFGDTFGFLEKEDHVFLLTVVESYRGEEAWARLLAANQFNEPPPEGMEYLLIYARVDYLPGVSDEALRLDQWDFRIVSQNQVLKPPTVVEPEPAFELEFFPGASGGGWMAWTVFVGDEAPLLVYGLDSDGSGGAYFAATPGK
jgi:hypothetical protein